MLKLIQKFRSHFSCYIIKLFFVFATVFYFPKINGHSLAVEKNYDIHHIKLTLKFNITEKQVFGQAEIKMTPIIDTLTVVKLHAKSMQINQIKFSNEQSVNFTNDSEYLSIKLPIKVNQPDTFRVCIDYQTIPEKGVFFVEPSKHKKHALQIYSHSEPNDASYWFPCYDHPPDKFTSEIIATVPDTLFLLSNGQLLEIKADQSNQTKTFHWYQNKPHTSYLVSIAAGKYIEIEDRAGTVPLYYYVYPHQREMARYSFSKTPDMVQYFEKLFGLPYPWDKYAQIVVADYGVGGMEHTSATTLTDRTIHDKRAHFDRNSDDLVAHELAHQWFGNLVTCEKWSHLWLNEGFATYAEILYKEHDLGQAAAQYAVYLDQNLYISMLDPEFHQPIVYENYADAEDMFNHIEYQKAGQVLHMLRNVLGDSLFFQSLKRYLHQFQFQSVKTSDFQKVVEEVSQKKWDWFFDQWLYQGGHPEFSITQRWFPQKKELELYVHQVQFDSLGLVPHVFQMPVEIEIWLPDRQFSESIFLKARQDTFSFKCPDEPKLVLFDKTNNLLKEMSFFKTQAEWIYQLENHPHIVARLSALEGLENDTIDTLATIIALETAVLNDPFWAVRREAAYLLMDFNRSQSKSILAQACRDSHPKVRTAAVIALGDFYDKKYNSLFRDIAANDSSYHVTAAALYALSHVEDTHTFDFLKRFIDMDSDQDVVRTAAFHSLYYLKDERIIPIAIKFAGDSNQPLFRRARSVSLLKEIGTGNETAQNMLLDLLDQSDGYLRKKVIDALGAFKNETVLKMLKQFENENLPSDVQHRLRISIRKIEHSLNKESNVSNSIIKNSNQ